MKDLIIDCFAGGGGASVGIEMALGRQVDIAINHDPDAILMHKTNHPDTIHLQESIWDVKPLKVTKGRHVGLLWASPDCKHFSKAKGGKPKDKTIRALPWAIVMWARDVKPDVIIAENVEEIQTWGPLDGNGYPIPERKGETFNIFIDRLRKLGYEVEWNELIAADYGAPTTRKRWYMIARCDGKPIIWPTPTHSKTGANGLPRWVPVSTVLDFSDLGKSIFGRKKPLAENTMNRIARGIEKFVFNNPEPFIMQIGQTGFSQDRNKSINDPLTTIVTKQEHCLISPMLIQYHSETARDHVRGQSVTEPLHTITTSPGHFGEVKILMVDKEEVRSEFRDKCNQVASFIIEYYGQGTAQSLNDPLHTIVTRDRFALVTIYGIDYVIVDITLRMLKPKELYPAQSFPADYIIDRDYTGKPYPIAKQVARCGNSVCPKVAKALVKANCSHLKIGDRIGNMTIDENSEQLKFA